jgi:hypothetical protein
MVGWGILLLVLGVGSLLLPMLDMQFRLMELLDPYQPWAGIVVAVIGGVLVFMGQTRRQPTAAVTSSHAPPPPTEGEEPPRQP